MQKLKKPVSVLLTLIMVLSLFTIVPITAGAVSGVSYIDANGNAQTANSVTEVSADTTEFEKSIAFMGTNGWYAVTSDITNSNRIRCSGDIHLILCDGAKLTLAEGIDVGKHDSITIYCQSGGNGALEIIDSVSSFAALGGGYDDDNGTITINGGTVTATSNGSGAAIGCGHGSEDSVGGTVIINGGTVTAVSNGGGAAIGGGFLSNGDCSVTINGGTVTAISNRDGAAIGGGADGGRIGSGDCRVSINGGTVTASSNGNGAAIGNGRSANGGTVTINGGTVTATATGDGAAIGNGINSSGSDIHLNWTKKSDSITASSYSGTVTLDKGFYNGTEMLSEGVVSDMSTISGKTLCQFWGFAGHSISLNGDIGLNYYLTGIEDGANVHFEWYNKTYDHTVTAEDFDATSGCYKVRVNVAAAEMNHPITATCTFGNNSKTDVYSVRQYADIILDSESDFSTDYAAKNGEKNYGLLVDLMKKMLDYGAKAQTRFGVTDVPLANTGVDYTMQPITADDIITKKTDMTKGLSKLGLTYIGTSVVFLSQTTLRHYYSVTNQNLFDSVKDSASFSYGEKGMRVYFERADIPAALLDAAQTFGIGEAEYNYSVLDYCKLVVADESKPQADRELAMATYWYNNAAKAYFYANDEYEDDMI